MENNIENNNDEILTEEIVKNEEEIVSDSPATAKKGFPIWIIPALAAVVISVLMVILLPGLFNKDQGGETEPVYKDYTVYIADTTGVPVSNIIVEFTTPEGELKKRVTDKNGVASLKNVLEGEYKVKLDPGLSDTISIEVTEYTLTKEVSELYVSVKDTAKIIELFGAVSDDAYGTNVGTDEYTLRFKAGESAYYVFTATMSGIYEVSITSDDAGATVGYFGIPMFVQENHCADGEYDGRSFELIIQDPKTPYVIGISATKDASVTLKIDRIADAPFDPEFVVWKDMEPTSAGTKCDTTGKTLVDFDIASKNTSVVLKEDGYYYTNTGKLVYIRITSTTGYGTYEDQKFNPVLGGSLALLAGFVDDKVGINIGGYIYDEDGNFVEKHRYNDVIAAYMEDVDATYGVVPLTAELAECIKLHGNSNGWYNKNSLAYLFDDILVNSENSWLFLCMVEQ